MRKETVPDREGGYALVMVLLGVAVLGLLLEMALLVSESSVDDVSDTVTRTKLDYAAMAGVNEAIIGLMQPGAATQWRLDGTPRQIVFDGVPVAVAAQSEAGKIDLNTQGRTVLVGLFAAAGLDNTEANVMVDRVMDWREPGPLKRLNGAKAADYRAANLPYGPRNGPFQSIDELNLVLDIKPDLIKTVQPAITVYNVLPTPELAIAPPLVLAASGLDSVTIEAMMAARARGEMAADSGLGSVYGRGEIAGSPGTVFTIIAQARLDRVTITRREIIRFTGLPDDPFWVLALH
jgi:general secretion pathway protein K